MPCWQTCGFELYRLYTELARCFRFFKPVASHQKIPEDSRQALNADRVRRTSLASWSSPCPVHCHRQICCVHWAKMALMDKLQPVLDGLAVFSGCLKTGKQVKQRGGLIVGGRIQLAAGTPVCRFILEIRWLTEHKLLIF